MCPCLQIAMLGIGGIIGSATAGAPYSATAVAMISVFAYMLPVVDLARILPEEVQQVRWVQ